SRRAARPPRLCRSSRRARTPARPGPGGVRRASPSAVAPSPSRSIAVPPSADATTRPAWDRVGSVSPMPPVARFNVTPVKSTALHHPERIRLDERGAAGDRRFFLVDASGKRFSGATKAPILPIRATYDEAADRLELRLPNGGVGGGGGKARGGGAGGKLLLSP